MNFDCTNEKLLTLIKQHDAAAFTELYNRNWKKLLAQANSFLHSPEEAEEVVQDVFVQLWKKRESITILHSLHTYMTAMTKYACLKMLAKRKQQLVLSIAMLPEAADNSTAQWLQFEDLQQELEDAVANLPEKCQLIFRYSREEELSDKQIAHRLHLSVNTVRTQMHRALKKLKTSLNSFFH